MRRCDAHDVRLADRVHERYFLPAILFVILFSAIDVNQRRAKTPMIACTFIFLASLLALYTSAYPIFGMRFFESALTMRPLSLGYVLIFAVVLSASIHRVMLHQISHAPKHHHPSSRVRSK